MLTTNTIATTTAAADDYVLNILVFLVRIHFLAKTFLGHISVNVCAHTHTRSSLCVSLIGVTLIPGSEPFQW